MKSFKLKIITPEKVFFDEETEQIIVRTTEGDIGILAGHENYVADLPAGPFRVKIDGKFKVAAISGGALKVSKEAVTILARLLNGRKILIRIGLSVLRKSIEKA